MNLNEQSTNGRAATRAATPNPILQRSEPPQSRHTTMEDLSAPAEQDPLDDMTLPVSADIKRPQNCRFCR